MCGIAGVLNLTNSSPIDSGRLRAACDALYHRGPDDGRLFTQDGIGLAARRLSIIDLAHGRQPMPNEDGTVHIAYNGEVHNHEDLRQGARVPRPRVPDARGYRSGPPRIRRVGARWASREAPRHVCLCRMGRASEDSFSRPRPHGNETPLLRRARGPVLFFVLDPKPALSFGAAAAHPPPRSRRFHGDRFCHRAPHDVRQASASCRRLTIS